MASKVIHFRESDLLHIKYSGLRATKYGVGVSSVEMSRFSFTSMLVLGNTDNILKTWYPLSISFRRALSLALSLEGCAPFWDVLMFFLSFKKYLSTSNVHTAYTVRWWCIFYSNLKHLVHAVLYFGRNSPLEVYINYSSELKQNHVTLLVLYVLGKLCNLF